MTFIKIICFIFLFGILFYFTRYSVHALDPYRSLCVGIQGRFNADSTWRGGSIQVGCAGDDGQAAPSQSQACPGEVQSIRPGQVYRLTKCSCFGSDRGCLKIGSELRLEPLKDGKRSITVVRKIEDIAAFKNNSCSINRTGEICGSNGQQINANIKITCNQLISTKSVSSGASASNCPTPSKVTNVRINCPNCFDAASP